MSVTGTIATGGAAAAPYQDLADVLQFIGKDPSRLIFEDELTGIHNRRFLLSYLEHKIRWQAEDDFPLSLLVIDLDKFKSINDTYGHDVGDQLLTWVASLLRDVAGEKGLPIRFGGDEFMLLLPGSERDSARELAGRLLQRARDRSFQVRDTGVTVPVTMSVGVATAPHDARSSRELFQAADTALYHAKQSGRDQAAVASEVDATKVFSRTALHRLRGTGIAGRGEQLTVVAEALEALARDESRFLVFEGTPGIGKTTFLETVRRSVENTDPYFVVRTSADAQEGFRPYHLTTRIVLDILRQLDDGGKAAIANLNRDDLSHLSVVLPQLVDDEVDASAATDSAGRQAIFATLAQFLPELAGGRPMVLLIDDLQFADEASLLLMRVLLQRPELAILVCGTALDTLQIGAADKAPPLQRFLTQRAGGVRIQRETLKPLTAEHVQEYLIGVFPNLRMPTGLEAELTAVTQGNPLFLGEIIRKLVTDRKVTLIGHEWVIEALEPGYLPRSLDEVVAHQIAHLDEEERRLLERASTLGEDVSVSMLAGSANLDEHQVAEFLDRAEALGLISLDFHLNDEVMRFLSKRVLEISYGEIAADRREALHEEIGSYQEGLYNQKLLPSASLLAYHYKRSANQEKARRYERLQMAYVESVFDADEAAHYASDLWEDEQETEPPLTPETIPFLPNVLRTIMSAARNIRLYPPESRAIGTAMEQVREALESILAVNEHVHLSQAQGVLLANSQRVDLSEVKVLAESFQTLLRNFELQGVVFYRGVPEREIGPLLMALGGSRPETIGKGYWRTFADEHALDHIELRQVRYSRITRRRNSTAAVGVGQDEALSPQELAEVPKLLRVLQGASKIVKLYPIDSKPVTQAIDDFHRPLQNILARRRALTLAGTDGTLLVNGERVDVSGWEIVASGFLELLHIAGLKSITFASGLPRDELDGLFGALRELPAGGGDEQYWMRTAQNAGLSHIGFNERQYAVSVIQSMLLPEDDSPALEDAPSHDKVVESWLEQAAEQPEEALREALPKFGRELLLKGEEELLRRLLRRAFHAYGEQPTEIRELTARACRRLLDSLIIGMQHKFTALAIEYLESALAVETDPRVIQELVFVLYEMTGSAVQFADYALAARILSGLRQRREFYQSSSNPDAMQLARLLQRPLDPTTQKLLVTDMRSEHTDRHEQAAQVLGSLGEPGIPLILEVIKQERDYRVRLTAASLLAEMGTVGAVAIKRAVVTDVIVEHRFRMLEVIDSVTRDLRHELEFALADQNPKVRRAAFQLFERLKNDAYIELIRPFALGDDESTAKGAIRGLQQLGSAAAAKVLIETLRRAESEELVILCCQALGQTSDPGAVDALASVIEAPKFLFMGHRWTTRVRMVALVAMRQIQHPHATSVLARIEPRYGGRPGDAEAIAARRRSGEMPRPDPGD